MVCVSGGWMVGWAGEQMLDQCSSFGSFLDVAIDNLHRAVVWATVAPLVGAFVTSWEWCVLVCTHCLGATWKVNYVSRLSLTLSHTHSLFCLCIHFVSYPTDVRLSVASVVCEALELTIAFMMRVMAVVVYKQGTAPRIVTAVMAENFKQPLGVWAMAGVWGLPHALLVRQTLPQLVAFGGDADDLLWLRRGVDSVVVVCGVGRALAAVVECWFVKKRLSILVSADQSPPKAD
jgi:hypothetical protein